MNPNIKEGYILFEGLDFTGKTTVARLLVARLNSGGTQQAIYHNGLFLPLHSEEKISKESPACIEEYFKGLFLRDEFPHLPLGSLLLQDRYFPSICMFGNMFNNSPIPAMEEIRSRYILPFHTFLFECSYDEKLSRSHNRLEIKTLDKVVIESHKRHDTIQALYREMIANIGEPFSIIDTTDRPSASTVEECYSILCQKK